MDMLLVILHLRITNYGHVHATSVSFPPSDCLLMPYDAEYCPDTLPYIGCCQTGGSCNVAIDQTSNLRCNATSTIACCPSGTGSSLVLQPPV